MSQLFYQQNGFIQEQQKLQYETCSYGETHTRLFFKKERNAFM